jgi:hypothetical protein
MIRIRLDPFRLAHWLNMRMLTPSMLAEHVGEEVAGLLGGEPVVTCERAGRLAEVLQVDLEQLLASHGRSSAR